MPLSHLYQQVRPKACPASILDSLIIDGEAPCLLQQLVETALVDGKLYLRNTFVAQGR